MRPPGQVDPGGVHCLDRGVVVLRVCGPFVPVDGHLFVGADPFAGPVPRLLRALRMVLLEDRIHAAGGGAQKVAT